jgi:hypothetical protein
MTRAMQKTPGRRSLIERLQSGEFLGCILDVLGCTQEVSRRPASVLEDAKMPPSEACRNRRGT